MSLLCVKGMSGGCLNETETKDDQSLETQIPEAGFFRRPGDPSNQARHSGGATS